MSLSKAQMRPVDPVLTDHARRRPAGKFVAERVFPTLLRKGQNTGQLRLDDDSHLLVPDDAYRAEGAFSSEAEAPEPSYVSYLCLPYARKILITQKQLDQWAGAGQDPAKLERSRLNKVLDQIDLIRERDLASKLNATANYDSGFSTTLGASVVWTADASDPVTDILTAIKALMDVVDASQLRAVADQKVWLTLLNHAAVRDYCKYTTPGPVSFADFQAFFRIEPVEATAHYDASGTISPVWEDGFIVFKPSSATEPEEEDADMAFGRTIVSEEKSVVRIDDPLRGHTGAYWLECEYEFCHQFIGMDNSTDKDSISGYLIDNAI